MNFKKGNLIIILLQRGGGGGITQLISVNLVSLDLLHCNFTPISQTFAPVGGP